jgi:hypothetical protein
MLVECFGERCPRSVSLQSRAKTLQLALGPLRMMCHERQDVGEQFGVQGSPTASMKARALA